MKKIIMILMIPMLLAGCDSKKQSTNIKKLQVSDDYYEIAIPYKKGAGNNYSITGVYNNYDLDELEKWLMKLSMKYFKVNNSYYQSGQYLKENDLKKLLSRDMLNDIDEIKIDGIKLDPTYVSYIHEQNYLDANGKLKGISLGIVLNPYQEYTNEYGAYLYKTVSENTLIEYGKKASEKLLDYLINDKKLSKNKFVIALYIESKPNDVLPGSFRYVGITSRNKINFKAVNYQYEYLKSDLVMSRDNDLYNVILSLEDKIKAISDDTYISGTVLYMDNKASEVELVINCSYLNLSDLMMISQIVNDEINNFFPSHLDIKALVQENNDIKALAIKENGEVKITILKK